VRGFVGGAGGRGHLGFKVVAFDRSFQSFGVLARGFVAGGRGYLGFV